MVKVNYVAKKSSSGVSRGTMRTASSKGKPDRRARNTMNEKVVKVRRRSR